MTEENVGCGSKSRVRESSDPIGSTKTDLSAFLEGMREVHAAMAEELGCPDWTYRDIPWVTSEVWGQLFDIAGEGNCKIVAMSRMGSNCRGQILISPAGMESLHVRAAAAKTALAAALPHLAQPSKSDEERAWEWSLGWYGTNEKLAIHKVFAPRLAVEFAAVRAEASAAKDAEIAALREALKPFAKYAAWVADNHQGWDHDGFEVGLPDGLSAGSAADRLGAFRAARAALEMSGGRSSET